MAWYKLVGEGKKGLYFFLLSTSEETSCEHCQENL